MAVGRLTWPPLPQGIFKGQCQRSHTVMFLLSNIFEMTKGFELEVGEREGSEVIKGQLQGS